MFASRFHACSAAGFLLVSAASGCVSWEDYEDFDYGAVFSDDGEAFSGVMRRYEGKDNFTHLAKRNHQTQLHTSDINDLDGLAPLTPWLKGQTIQRTFMRSAGYHILIRAEDELEAADEKTRMYHVDRVDLNGGITNLLSRSIRTMVSCDGGTSYTGFGTVLEVVPSPSGETLAMVEVFQECGPGKVELSLLDPETLAVTDGPFDVELPTSGFPQQVGPSYFGANGWLDSADDVFVMGFEVGSPSGLEGWSFAVGEAPEEVSGIEWECLTPATTSSVFNELGQTLSLDSQTGVATLDTNSVSSFGCP